MRSCVVGDTGTDFWAWQEWEAKEGCEWAPCYQRCLYMLASEPLSSTDGRHRGCLEKKRGSEDRMQDVIKKFGEN